MTARDLIQQRTTLPNGDTIWKYSPLVAAAIEGKLAILDGLHRLHSSTLSILHRLILHLKIFIQILILYVTANLLFNCVIFNFFRLIQDRDLQLHDGTRLLRSDRYDKLAKKLGVDVMQKSNIVRVHPAFRIIALAEPPG